MRFARLSAFILLAAPALAATEPPPLPALDLPAERPVIAAQIAGQDVLLTVDFGADPVVLIGPEAHRRLGLGSEARADGKLVRRGLFQVSVGQVPLAVPFSRETLVIAGRQVTARVLAVAAVPDGQAPGSDGVIGLPLLPHGDVQISRRTAGPPDAGMLAPVVVQARISGNSGALGFDWPLPDGAGRIEVELHNLRAAGMASVASVAGASRLAQAGGGHLDGPVRRVVIGFGVARPVRRLLLDRPVMIAGLAVTSVDVRLFDWAGAADLPPDAGSDRTALTVI
ncbi:MAG: hypothetical protein ACOYO0_04350, partial [Sandarakinorhabdus sp.]